ncbi:MAG: hypothetical protein E6H08_02720 [Bacteroidetes bacterium]|nr:MAG: hypothetical protein E6H08_02720 [Bacteroidota bacterium]
MESFFASTLRSFWADGLNAITGAANQQLIDTFDDKKGYVFYHPIQVQLFKAKITDFEVFLRGYASDINRFGCAAIESMNEIHYKPFFTKSHSWKCIKVYYASYYAAHALLRLHGISCTNFERENLNHIEKVADLWGMQNGLSIEKGYYQCILDSLNKEIFCTKIVASGNKGSHEQLWSVFLNHLDYVITEISSLPATVELQRILTKLADLKNTLTAFGSNGGNWLSKVRNEINYKHKNGLWYPYKDAEKYFNRIEAMIENWEKVPDQLDLTSNYDKPILRFLDACIFMVSLYLNSAKDMADKCPKGTSFQSHGVLSFLNKINK